MSAEDIKKLEEELKQARSELYQIAKLAEMGKLVAVVAHELSQPLLGIKAFAQILKRRFKNDGFVEPKVRMIEEQAIHMEGILDSLRQYSKTARFDAQQVDPLVPVQNAIELFKERAKKIRVDLILDVQGEPLPEVKGNRGHLQQVMVNLVGNALDELEKNKKGSVLIRVFPDGDHVVVRVVDTGSGIPDEVRDRLFEPFYSTKGEEKGTGLGLSICRDILRSHQGEIHLMEPEKVQQEFGDAYGAAFEVRLAKAGESEAGTGSTGPGG